LNSDAEQIVRGREFAIQENGEKKRDKINPGVHVPLTEVTGCFSATEV
jgi:hypothetical protein